MNGPLPKVRSFLKTLSTAKNEPVVQARLVLTKVAAGVTRILAAYLTII